MIEKEVLEFTHQFCIRHLGKYDYQRLYIIGSRARDEERPGSDHDFVAVIEDDAPAGILTGRNTELMFELDRSRRKLGLGKIDLIVAKRYRFEESKPSPEDFVPYACARDGRILWERAEG